MTADPLKELGYGLLPVFILAVLVRSMFVGTFPDMLLALSIGAAIGIAWAWWDEKKKEKA